MHPISADDIDYAKRIGLFYWSKYNNRYYIDYKEAISIAYLALCEAARLYEDDRGNRSWRQYYHTGIRYRMMDAITAGHRKDEVAIYDRYIPIQDNTISILDKIIIDQMIDALSPQYQQVITMRYLLGASMQEIQDAIGYNGVWSAYDAIAKAREQMRRVGYQMGVC